MSGAIVEDYETGGRSSSTDEMLSEQRCQSGDSLAEWRSCEQVENGTPSTSPPFWDSDDEDDCGELSYSCAVHDKFHVYLCRLNLLARGHLVYRVSVNLDYGCFWSRLHWSIHRLDVVIGAPKAPLSDIAWEHGMPYRICLCCSN